MWINLSYVENYTVLSLGVRTEHSTASLRPTVSKSADLSACSKRGEGTNRIEESFFCLVVLEIQLVFHLTKR